MKIKTSNHNIIFELTGEEYALLLFVLQGYCGEAHEEHINCMFGKNAFEKVMDIKERMELIA